VDPWHHLFEIILLLGGGFLLGALAERLRQSAILGYLAAGMLLGPNVLHLVETQADVTMLAELGVALLLFSIGLEFSWARLRRMGASGLGGGAVQVVVTVLLFGLAALAFGVGPATGFTIGAILALSSTTYVLRVLSRRAELDSLHGRASIGVLLLQDIAVVPLVLLVSVLVTGGTPTAVLVSLGRLLGFTLLLVVAFRILFQHVVPRFLGTGVLARNRELPLLLAVTSGLGAALAAHAAGVSPAIGAFLAGMMLAASPFAVQVRADVGSLKTILMTLFFGSVGMMGDPAWIAAHPLPVAALVLATVLGKAVLVAFSLRLFRTPAHVALAGGICLAQIGEFSFILAEMARGRLLDDATFRLIISATLVTLVATPYLVAHAPRLAGSVLRRLGRRPAAGTAPEAAVVRGHVLVVGYGPTGRAVADGLVARGFPVHVIDLNPRSVEQALGQGRAASLGDATFPEVLEHAVVERAAAVAVTLPDTAAARAVVEQARALAPCARVFVRARYHVDHHRLVQAGAHVVVDEEEEMGRALVRAMADELGRIGVAPAPDAAS